MLESYLDDENNFFHDMVDHSSSFEDAIVAENYPNGFIETLSEKDMEILNMRMNGFTYEKIATMLGYKTHSGIVKRMKIITDSFLPKTLDRTFVHVLLLKIILIFYWYLKSYSRYSLQFF